MHIPDGFLSNDVAVALAVPAVVAVGYGLRRAEVDLDDRRVPLLGVTAAFVFAAQMLNFPVAGGTSGHFLGAALAAFSATVRAATRFTCDFSHFPLVGLCPDCSKEPHDAHP